MHISDVEMDSVGLCHCRSIYYDPHHLRLEGSRRLLVASAEAVHNDGFATQRLSVLVIADIKAFTRRSKDEDHVKSGISKVKSDLS